MVWPKSVAVGGTGLAFEASIKTERSPFAGTSEINEQCEPTAFRRF